MDNSRLRISTKADLQLHIDRRFKLSVVSSVAAKISACALQLMSIPIAVKYLGVAGYAEFAVIFATSLAPQIFVIRHGPVLSGPVAALFAAGDWPAIAKRMWAAFVVSLVTMLLSAFSFVALLWVDVIATPIAGESIDAATLTATFLTLIAMHLCVPLFIVFEDTQNALHESHLQGLRVTIGNIAAIVTMIFLIPKFPTTFCYAMALTLPPFAIRIINILVFLMRHHRELWVRVPHLTSELINTARIGLLFTTVVGIGSFASNQLPVVVAAGLLTPSQTASVSVIQQLTLAVYAFGSVICVGYLPAFNTSLSSGNTDWATQSLKRIEKVFLMLGTTCVVGFILFGRAIHYFLLKSDLAIDNEAIWFAGAYSVLLIVENFYYLLATSVRQTTRASLTFVFRSGLTGLAAFVSCALGYPPAIWLSGSLLILAITVTTFRHTVLQALGADKMLRVPNEEANSTINPQQLRGLSKNFLK